MRPGLGRLGCERDNQVSIIGLLPTRDCPFGTRCHRPNSAGDPSYQYPVRQDCENEGGAKMETCQVGPIRSVDQAAGQSSSFGIQKVRLALEHHPKSS